MCSSIFSKAAPGRCAEMNCRILYSIRFLGFFDRQNCTGHFTSPRAIFPSGERALTCRRPNEAVTNAGDIAVQPVA
jgi:hypothetical protein